MKIAIVGSGPSGFYAADALIDSELELTIHMYEKFPVPYGLVRSGVAPDHPKLKLVTHEYDRIAGYSDFEFRGNVEVGVDVEIQDLLSAYNAVILATGAQDDRTLGIPGEDLAGSYSAREFVNWYNGHPEYRNSEFDLSHEIAAIIGNGNVAVDVARILLKSVDELKHTDIAAHALDALSDSKVREIHIIGRRGPAQANITNKELRELLDLENCGIVVDADVGELNSESVQELDKKNLNSVQNVELFGEIAKFGPTDRPKRCHFHFLRSPVAVVGEQHVSALRMAVNCLRGKPFAQSAVATHETTELSCGLLFRSIGYRGTRIRGVPFDERTGRVPHDKGRVSAGLYVTGWMKRGPTGIIGTNRADSAETVASLLEDAPQLAGPRHDLVEELTQRLRRKGVRITSFADWQRIDRAEKERGQRVGKPREKFTRVEEMLAHAGQTEEHMHA